MFGGFVTVENLMYLAGGLLAAWLIALPVVPLVHERAVRLMRRRYEALQRKPDRQMEQAILRADFAMSTRRLEHAIGVMTDRAAAHMREIADKRAALQKLKDDLQKLKDELAAREAKIAELARRDAGHSAQLAAACAEREAARAEAAATATVLRQAQDDIRALRAEIAALTAALNRRIALHPRQEYEITTRAARTQPASAREAAAALVVPAPAPAFAPQAPASGANDDRHAIARAVQAILAEGAATMTRH